MTLAAAHWLSTKTFSQEERTSCWQLIASAMTRRDTWPIVNWPERAAWITVASVTQNDTYPDKVVRTWGPTWRRTPLRPRRANRSSKRSQNRSKLRRDQYQFGLMGPFPGRRRPGSNPDGRIA